MANSWARTLLLSSGLYRRYLRSKSTTTNIGTCMNIMTSSPRGRAVSMASPPLLAAGILHWSSTAQRSHSTSTTTRNDGSKENKPKPNNEDVSTPQLPFDVTKQWSNAKDYLEQQIWVNRESSPKDETLSNSQTSADDDGSSRQDGWMGFLKGLGGPGDGNDDHSSSGDHEKRAKETQETKQNLNDVKSSLMGMLMGRSPNQNAVEDLIAKARNSSEQGDVSDSVSLEELLNLMRSLGDEFDQLIKKYLHGKDLPAIFPSNLYYFLENEDEVKNFSWRRRKHRFCRGINLDYVNELYAYMRIAEIGYLDDMDAIKRELSETFGYEVIYCQMEARPTQPSHFVAVKKNQSQWSSSLDMMICVCGTKTITDVITDLLADAVDYRGGKAHSGICKGGKYLAEKHMSTMETFMKASGKTKINLTLVGHSLGAGAASIAGIELQDRDDFDVQVIGFGCPALVSKELSESAQDYITTVVSDNDCIPRMSLPNMINTILNIGEYNWVPRARQDLEDVIIQVQSALPSIISDSVKQSLLEVLTTKVLSTIEIPPATKDRIEPVLFPRKYRAMLETMHNISK
jgi:hypothetical protein